VGAVIRIPVYLFAAQWALLAALAMFVVIMYRQLGRLLTRSDKVPELGPAVGGQAAALSYISTADRQERQLIPREDGPALVAFADPTCPSCEQLVGVLGELAALGPDVLDGAREWQTDAQDQRRHARGGQHDQQRTEQRPGEVLRAIVRPGAA